MQQTPTPVRWMDPWVILLAGICMVGLIVGVMFSSEPWGVAMTASSGVAVALCIVSGLIRIPVLAWAGALGSACGGMVWAGLYAPQQVWTESLMTAGIVGLIGLCLLGIWRVLPPRVPRDPDWDLNHRMLEEIRDAALLSDSAKRVIFREREVALLRRTIDDDIEKGEFNAGLILCADMERLFGYAQEAEGLRQKLLLARNRRLAEEIDREVATVGDMLDAGQVDEAEDMSHRLSRLYPDSPALHGLEARVRSARAAWKHELKQAFLSTAQRGETDEAMAMLRELDHSLDPTEAAEVRQAAAETIARYRESLSVRFKMAVSDHRWSEALAMGEQIINEFPNDRMANEVRGLYERLQERAAEEA